MKCPYCGFDDSKVIDSRPKENKIKRRRECTKCLARFTTFEAVEKPLLMVEKKSGMYEPFDSSKLIKGIYSAIKKRPVTYDQVEDIANYVENHFANDLKTVAKSREIGELVLEKLREIDLIAYIRFASVYEEFTDIASFVEMISELERKNTAPDDKLLEVNENA
ncbi:transcriptional regulator NrdR [Ruminococcus sp. XPD3002]|uniref:transcriptional regulator NrdR n=1 Tax=Ruminococcus sp. XPD3002 TaxID=1452269 RepID=UPI0009129A9C|nr:transcriptional repressor NrdR [Ruminococcus sp.]SFX74202.1 transcriptional repressor NrdR [Ruminococcus flavefaciens]HPY84092.1 transcriptional regulator NrdR [Ruminococcus flavefaciens]HRU97080.1 transcriptional regulator NrdR [Ruminococcus sp.]